MNWDMNGRAEWSESAKSSVYQGKPLNRQQNNGLFLVSACEDYGLTADLWIGLSGLSVAAMSNVSRRPRSYNTFAWMIATNDVP